MEITHKLRKPIDARHAFRKRRITLALGIILALGIAAALMMLLIGCGGGSSTPVSPPPAPVVQPLQVSDVQNIALAAVNSVNVDMVVAVVDRAGFVLGVFRTQNAPTTATGNFGQTQDADDLAVALARTGAFFSNDQAPLSSRTVRFISGIHFPPGVMNQPPADLYGIENTNRGCTLVNDLNFQSKIPPSLSLSGGFGPGVITGKADTMDSNATAVNPGGVPIFYKNVVLGGIGAVTSSSNLNVAEFAAFTGSTTSRTGPTDTFRPTPAAPGVVFIGGIALPFVNQTSLPAGFSSGPVSGTGSFLIAPANSQGQPPEGDLITSAPGPVGGLSAAEVKQILDNAEATANTTRAAIRLPLGSKTRMAIAVADLDGTIIGLRRMPDSTVFSIDVAATKARNMVYFNSSSRTVADLNGVPMGTFHSLYHGSGESLHTGISERRGKRKQERDRFFPGKRRIVSQRRPGRRARRQRRRRGSGRLRDQRRNRRVLSACEHPCRSSHRSGRAAAVFQIPAKSHQLICAPQRCREV
ncbi:MAG: hypothetical protein AUG13_01015 [Chloroflexi bacterium 13_1_20CM_2_59_7]|nr:MAG: hypothetical protein AUG13_01015 [Chloroflexi bacterium 13_1_20CM_2_59_7]